MGFIKEQLNSIKSIQFRQLLTQAVSLGMIMTSALILWKALMCVTGREWPFLSCFPEKLIKAKKKNLLLFLHMSKEPIRAGEIVVFNVDLHERPDTGEVETHSTILDVKRVVL